MNMLAFAITYRFSQASILLLGALLLVWSYWRLANYREGVLRQFLGDRYDSVLAVKRSLVYSTWRTVLLALSWLLATIALMGPLWNRTSTPKTNQEVPVLSNDSAVVSRYQRKPYDIIFALDVSASMTATDTPTGQPRIDYARDLIGDTIARLPADNIGLYLFTSEVKDLIPATLDHLYLRMELQKVGINSVGIAGTDFRKVLGNFYTRFWATPSDRAITLVLITDGGDTTLEGLPDDQRGDYIQVIARQLGNASTPRKVLTVGIGSTIGQNLTGIDYQGGPIHSSLMVNLLQQIARIGNGVYLQDSDFEGPGLSEELYTRISEADPSSQENQLQQGTTSTGTFGAPPIDLQWLPLLGAIILLIVSLGLPETEEEQS